MTALRGCPSTHESRESESPSSFDKIPRLLESASLLVINSLEKVFYWWGRFVASHPYAVIACALAATAACGAGFLNFTSMADVQGGAKLILHV